MKLNNLIKLQDKLIELTLDYADIKKDECNRDRSGLLHKIKEIRESLEVLRVKDK